MYDITNLSVVQGNEELNTSNLLVDFSQYEMLDDDEIHKLWQRLEEVMVEEEDEEDKEDKKEEEFEDDDDSDEEENEFELLDSDSDWFVQYCFSYLNLVAMNVLSY